MKVILKIKSVFEDLYKRNTLISGYVLRLILNVAVLFILRGHINFNPTLSEVWFILAFAAAAAFIPARFLTLALVAYISVQFTSLSLGIGCSFAAIMVIFYLLYFRFNSGYALLLIVIPVLFMIRLPLLVPLVLAVTMPLGTIVVAVTGYITYYMMHYIYTNAAVISGLAPEVTEFTKINMFFTGLFAYREFWYATGSIIAVFAIVYFIRKLNINRSNDMAVLIGTGAYIILIVLFNLIFGTVTVQRLIYTVAGGLVSMLLAMLISNFLLPIDFTRTEFLEFEDEEYYYYVRAVPKMTIDKESVHVKRINRRVEKP